MILQSIHKFYLGNAVTFTKFQKLTWENYFPKLFQPLLVTETYGILV